MYKQELHFTHPVQNLQLPVKNVRYLSKKCNFLLAFMIERTPSCGDIGPGGVDGRLIYIFLRFFPTTFSY